MDDLTTKKRVRGGHRASASKLVAKIVEAIPKASPEKDLVWLRQSQITLRDKIKMLKELDEHVIDILSASKDEDADEQLGKEIEDSDEAIAELERTLLQLDDALGKLGGQSLPLLSSTDLTSAEGNLDQSHVSISSAGKIIRAKLPKLRLRNFGGKICEWPEFWDGFSSSIDNNDQLSDVDKFAYLRGYLEGPAKSTIADVSLVDGSELQVRGGIIKETVRKEKRSTTGACKLTNAIAGGL